MKTVGGTPVQGGVAIGPLRVRRVGPARVEERSALSPAREGERLARALRRAGEELELLRLRALEEAGGEAAAILELQQLVLEDEDFLDALRGGIEGGFTAQFSSLEAGERFAAEFAAMDAPYMQARAGDLRDVSRRLAALLEPPAEAEPPWEAPAILAASDLSPSETVQLDRGKLLGFVTRHGSPNGHTAILARSLGIPALTGVDFDDGWDGRPAVLDGDAGTLQIDPDPAALAAAAARLEEGNRRRALLESLRGRENVTLDGRRVEVYANIGGIADAEEAVRNDAGGVGLFRTEMLFLGSEDWPGEEEQFRVYRRAAELFAGRPVLLRTMDVGADKGAAYLGLEPEENPALGRRGIRVSLTRTDRFRCQLRAVLRAAAFGNIGLMFPMIVSVDELRAARALLDACRAELEAEGTPAGPLKVGVMIETPAAVMTAGELAEEADFFSLGTNDLTQYTLALDRQNPRLSGFWNPRHPAVLRMIGETAEAAHRHGIPVGLCGELAGDLSMTRTLLELGVDELSVPPAAVLPLRAHIRGLRLREEGEEP